MNLRIFKGIKWGMSALRVVKTRAIYGSHLKLTSGKPLYLGRGVRVVLGKGASLSFGTGVYLSPGCFLQVGDGASLVLMDGVYMNEGCRVVANESISIGEGTLFGPNVQIYDHEHRFDRGGVRPELYREPVIIGKHCWLCANVVVTRGCTVANHSLVSANSVVTRNLCDEGALYAGSPACLIKRYD